MDPLLEGEDAQREYLRLCADSLIGVLRGEINPLETLFPNGDETLARNLYEKSSAAVYLNRIVAAAVSARVTLRPKTPLGYARRLRILEIGAGTGATTAAILKQLSPEEVDYTFSDVSEVFLARGRQRFREHSIDFAHFDLERDEDAHAYAGHFDVVVIANALHVARDLRAALARVLRVLQPGGTLVLLETTAEFAWSDVSIGTIEGWQHFEDEARTDSPLLPVDRWVEELAAAGFEQGTFVPMPHQPTSDLGLHVVVAHRPMLTEDDRVESRPDAARFLALSGRSPLAESAYESSLEAHAVSPSGDESSVPPLREELNDAPSRERLEIVTHAVLVAVARVLGQPELPPKDARLMELGMDSLMAMELRNTLQKSFGIPELSTTVMFDYPTSSAIAGLLLSELGYTSNGEAVQPETDAPQDAQSDATSVEVHSTADLDAMSDDEIAVLLLRAVRSVMVNQNPLENEKQPATTSTRPADHGALLRQALRAVEQMQQRVEASESSAKRLAHQPIAVVGIGCRFPGGANDTASFWQLLREGREAIREVPQDRWKIDDFYDPDPATPGKMVSRFGGFLDEIDKFDAGYFGIAPREAAMMDPQQRLLLEVTIQALESGAIPPSSLAGTQTGVYLGMASGDYGQLQIQHGDSSLLDMHFASGNAHSIASGRLAYLLGFKGPGVTLDTACSSSLVAVHLACQALRTGDCSVAIAGGVNIILLPETTVALSHAHMLSPDGRSKAFDARADGFARAEGCGIVVLKSLAQAESDGDRIFAVIRGSAVNQDGASSSLTAPNGPSQEALMRAALQDAGIGSGINASSIGYIEAHGTGTALGDPIELRALGAVYGAARRSSEPVLVGSLKTNFGHMEAAAGVGGLIKLILALEHAEIPPHATIQTPTPHVPWPQLRLGIPRSVEPWPTSLAAGGQEPPRTGVVSSFGFSGTNAHLIVEQAPQGNGGGSPQPGEQIGRILPLSAKSAPALDRLVVRYEAALAPSAQASAWADFAATAGEGRDHFPYRLAVVASNCQEATGLLQRYRAESRPNVATKTRNLAFLFTGQGSERSGMGLGLLQASRVFRSAIERLDGAVGSTLGTSIATIWANESGELERASLVQPAIYAYGWALSELWRNWGVVPRVVLGHSLGEYVAATVAGVLSPEEGIRLVAARGRLTEELARAGGMLAVVADRETVQSIVGDIEGIAFAAINGPSSVVLSGKLEAIELCENRLKIHELRFKRLRTTHGFHSETLDGMLQAFEAEASHVAWNVPEIRWISNLTGRPVERSQPVDASYWRSQLRETVQFQMVLESAGSSGADLYLELGTEPQLLALAEANGIDSERCIASLRKGGLTGEFSKLLQAAASLYMAGVDLDWRSIHRDHPSVNEPARKVALPGYPFERQRFWFTESAGSRRGQATPSSVTSNHPLLATRLRISSKQTIFQSTVSPQQPAYLGDHILGGMRILPGAAYLEMAIAACRHEGADKHWRAVDFEFREPCLFDEPRLLEAVLYPTEDKTQPDHVRIAVCGQLVERRDRDDDRHHRSRVRVERGFRDLATKVSDHADDGTVVDGELRVRDRRRERVAVVEGMELEGPVERPFEPVRLVARLLGAVVHLLAEVTFVAGERTDQTDRQRAGNVGRQLRRCGERGGSGRERGRAECRA